LTGVDAQAAVPDAPAGRDSAFLPRRAGAPRILLRQSVALLLVLATGIGVAGGAVYTALAPWLGAARAVLPTLAFLAVCGLATAAWRRKQPAVIEIAPDWLAASSHDGTPIVQGRLTGASQWGTSLLALELRRGKRRAAVLVAADALDPEAFRTLAVRARSAAGR
jgi:hypothetical protein